MNALPLSSVQIQEAMSRLSYFKGWRPDQLGRLAAGAQLLELPKNTSLVSKGDKLGSLFVLISGQIRIYIPLPAEGERVISLVEHGESFGEACLVLGEACPFDAITTRNSHVIAIDAHAYQNELSQEPAQMERVLSLVSQRLINTLRDMEICSQRSSLQRVACFLLQYMPHPDSNTYEIQLPARKRDIAAKLGLSQETFSRVLAFLGKQGVIQVKGSQISVENGRKLATLSPGGCPSEAEVV
jgi:CRP-like cAMP-binding protein